MFLRKMMQLAKQFAAFAAQRHDSQLSVATGAPGWLAATSNSTSCRYGPRLFDWLGGLNNGVALGAHVKGVAAAIELAALDAERVYVADGIHIFEINLRESCEYLKAGATIAFYRPVRN